MRKSKILYVILIGLFLFCWAVMQPFDSAPDEYMRYQVCDYIYQYHSLPSGTDPLMRNEIWGYSYAFFPILPQMVAAVFMMIASIFTKDFFALVVAARMTSVLCGVGTAWFCIRIAERVWKNRAYQWMFPTLVVLLPQVTYLFSYLNNDSMALLASAVIIDAWLAGQEGGWQVKSCIQLAVGVILCALSYYNAYGVILASVLVFLGALVQAFSVKEKRMNLVKKGILMTVIVLAGIAWWFIRSAILYDGDFLGLHTSEVYGELYAVEVQKPSNRYTPLGAGESLFFMLFQKGWIVSTLTSFIGNFGYLTIQLPLWMYGIYVLIFAGGIVGGAVRLCKNRQMWREKGLLWMALFLTAAIPVALSMIHSYTVDYQPQGRYCMPMLLPLMYAVTMGWEWIFEKTAIKKYAGWILCGIWMVLALISGFGVFIPNIR